MPSFQVRSHVQVLARTKNPRLIVLGASFMSLLEAYKQNSLELLKFSAVRNCSDQGEFNA